MKVVKIGKTRVNERKKYLITQNIEEIFARHLEFPENISCLFIFFFPLAQYLFPELILKKGGEI